LKNYIRQAVLTDPDGKIYLAMPKDADWVRADMDYPNVHIIETSTLVGGQFQRWNIVRIPQEIKDLFSDFCGKYIVDAVVFVSPEHVPQYVAELFSTVSNNSLVPITYSNVMFGLSDRNMNEPYRVLQSAGLQLCDGHAWVSEVSYKRSMEVVRRHVSPAIYNKIDSSCSKVRTMAIPLDYVKQFNVKEKPKDKWVVNYGYGFNSAYDYQAVFEIVDALYSVGYPLRFIMNTSSKAQGKHGNDFTEVWKKRYEHHFDYTYGLPQEEFWKRASEAHAFLFLATDAEGSFSVIEQFMLGLVGVFKYSDWLREFLYPGYPYVAKTNNEIATLLKYVCENYFTPEVQEVLQKQTEHIRNLHDVPNLGKIHKEVMDLSEKRKSKFPPPKNMVSVVSKIPESQTRITFDELCDFVQANIKFVIDLRDIQPNSRCKSVWRLAMHLAGWRDDPSTSDTTFIRGTV